MAKIVSIGVPIKLVRLIIIITIIPKMIIGKLESVVMANLRMEKNNIYGALKIM